MATATVTSKGQVTIPVDVRSKLGLRPGSRLEFVPTADGGFSIHAEGGSVADLKGAVPKPAHPVTIDEMRAAVVAEAVDPT